MERDASFPSVRPPSMFPKSEKPTRMQASLQSLGPSWIANQLSTPVPTERIQSEGSAFCVGDEITVPEFPSNHRLLWGPSADGVGNGLANASRACLGMQLHGGVRMYCFIQVILVDLAPLWSLGIAPRRRHKQNIVAVGYIEETRGSGARRCCTLQIGCLRFHRISPSAREFDECSLASQNEKQCHVCCS